MLAVLRRYGAMLGVAPKLFVNYRAWFWANLFVQILMLTIFVFFWRAVYAERTTIAGLSLRQTLDYILLAQLLLPAQPNLVFHVGELLVSGNFVMELLRPLNLLARFYCEALGWFLTQLVQKLPVLLFAVLVFDLRLPGDPLVWLTFLVSLLLGHGAVFLFAWIFVCLAFRTTESWGLAMVQQAIGSFFSGALVPLVMMPDWLRSLTLSLPFAQGIYVPVALLSGITPLAEAPRLWLVQVGWILGLWLVSRWVFAASLRKITVQGG